MKTYVRTITETRHYVETVTTDSSNIKYVERDAKGHRTLRRHLASDPSVDIVDDWREASQIELALLGKAATSATRGSDDCGLLED